MYYLLFLLRIIIVIIIITFLSLASLLSTTGPQSWTQASRQSLTQLPVLLQYYL